ncbi:MAG: cytochrome c oxidase subunit 3 [Planctomycetia bacterium]
MPTSQNRHAKPLPRGTAILGMWLFLAALGSFFLASVASYLLIRLAAHGGPPLGTVRLPLSLYLSTGLLIVSSWTMHQALVNVRRERQRPFRRYLAGTLALGCAFLAVQVPSLIQLLADHDRFMNENVYLYGLVMVLVVFHGLHVVGGLIPLAVTTVRAYFDRYDHECHLGVSFCAMYWHFLDAVWLLLFGAFVAVG